MTLLRRQAHRIAEIGIGINVVIICVQTKSVQEMDLRRDPWHAESGGKPVGSTRTYVYRAVNSLNLDVADSEDVGRKAKPARDNTWPGLRVG